ncbi:hypothetical protein MMC22_008520 [Lobaria immixta]|nr:hypothetical protein [Lobaria immixta]
MDLDDDLDLSADEPRQDQVVDTNVVSPVDTVEAMEAELASIDALRRQAILARRLASARKEQEQGFLLVNPEVTTANRPVNPRGAMVDETRTGYVRDVDIRKEELQLYVPKVPTYRGGFYQKLLGFVRACEHMYGTRPVTYRSVKGRVMLAKGNLQESFHAKRPTLLADWFGAVGGSKVICQLRSACYAIRKQDTVTTLPFETMKATLHSIDIHDRTLLANMILRRYYFVTPDLVKEYKDIRQRNTDSVEDLVDRINILEEQMSPQPELAQVHIMLFALHLKRQGSFQTRKELQKPAVELEALETKKDRRQDQSGFKNHSVEGTDKKKSRCHHPRRVVKNGPKHRRDNNRPDNPSSRFNTALARNSFAIEVTEYE